MVNGFTLILKTIGVPAHPLADGVTVIVAVTTAVPVLAAVKDGIFPFPLATRPIEGVLLVQAKVVPLTALLSVTGADATPLQSEISAT